MVGAATNLPARRFEPAHLGRPPANDAVWVNRFDGVSQAIDDLRKQRGVKILTGKRLAKIAVTPRMSGVN
jgi:hypothetical protein